LIFAPPARGRERRKMIYASPIKGEEKKKLMLTPSLSEKTEIATPAFGRLAMTVVNGRINPFLPKENL